MVLAAALDLLKAGNNRPARIAIIAITTSSSMSVNANRARNTARFCARVPAPKAPEDWRSPKPGGAAVGSRRWTGGLGADHFEFPTEATAPSLALFGCLL